MSSPDGFETMYKEHLLEPLQKCIESYEPLDGISVVDLIKESEHFGRYNVMANFSGCADKWEEETVLRSDM